MMPPNVLLRDEFRRGLDLADTWVLVSRPPSFVADERFEITSVNES